MRLQTLHLLAFCSLFSQPVLGQDYCIPSTLFGPDGGDYVARVQLGGIEAIDNTSTFTAGISYQDYTYSGPGRWTRLQAGNTYFLTITAGTTANTHYAAWIDYAGDGAFEADEQIAFQQNTTAGEVMIFSFSVPAELSAINQEVRLRVRAAFNMTVPDPCASFLYGETEDYIVLLDNGNACVPFANFGTTEGDRITAVSIADLTIPSFAQTEAYFNGDIYGAAVQLGGDHTIQVTSGEYANNSIAVWADWSGNGSFESGPELLGAAATSTPFETVTIPFTVPTEFPELGQVRLRIRLWFGDVPDPCNTQNYGQTLDLTLGIELPSGPCQVPVSAYAPVYTMGDVTIDGFSYGAPPVAYPHYGMSFTSGPVIVRGTEHTVTIPTTLWNTRASAWLDNNGDGDLGDADELIGSVLSPPGGGPVSITFTVPPSTPVGHAWLRVRTARPTADPFADGCAFQLFSYGQVLDIRLTIEDPSGPCMPQSDYWTLFGDYIDGVELNTLSNTGTGGLAEAEYQDYTAISTFLPIGSSQVLSITSGLNATDRMGAMIDWDGDGTWEGPGEFLGVFFAGGSFSTVSIPFTVPNVAPGPKRLRVRAFPDATGAACAAEVYGETEDYTVVVEVNTGIIEPAATGPRLLGTDDRPVVEVNDAAWNGASIALLDASGRSVGQGTLSTLRQPLEMHGLPAGVYVVRLEGTPGTWSKRFPWTGL